MGHTPLAEAHTSWLAGDGSSMSRRASDQPCASWRPVKFVLKVSENVNWGTVCRTGVGVPPVHVIKTSDVRSLSPSTRMKEAAAEALHDSGGAVWPQDGRD